MLRDGQLPAARAKRVAAPRYRYALVPGRSGETVAVPHS